MKERNILIRTWSVVSGIIVALILIYIIGFIFINGFDVLSYDFIFSKPGGFPLGTEGGIFPAIVGSLLFTLVATTIASIIALSTSIYITFYCRNERLKNFIRLIIRVIAGVPSIVLGLFGYSFLIVYLNLRISILTAGIILGIMIFPFIQVRFEKAFLEIDENILKASYAMGINKLYTIMNIVLPMCYKDMISAISMAGSFAMGATAPILFTGAVMYSSVPKDIFSPSMALPLHLYMLINEGISLEKAYGTALVLIIILLIMNSFSIIFEILKGVE